MTDHAPFTAGWAEAFQRAQRCARTLSHAALTGEHLVAALAQMPMTAIGEMAAAIGVDAATIAGQIDPSTSQVDIDTTATTAITMSSVYEHCFAGTDHLAVALCANDSPAGMDFLSEIRRRTSADAVTSEHPVFAYVTGLARLAAPSKQAAREMLSSALWGYSEDGTMPRRIADTHFLLGQSYRHENNSAAADSFRSAAEIYASLPAELRTEGATYIEAHCAFYLGCIAQLGGHHQTAAAHFAHALPVYAWLPHTDGQIAKCAMAWSMSLREVGFRDAAIELLRVAIDAQKKNLWMTNNETVDICYGEIARIEADIRGGHHDRATTEQFDAGMAALRSVQEHNRSNAYGSALAAARDALHHFEAVGATKYVADAHGLIGHFLDRAEDRGADADVALKRAHVTYSELQLHKLAGHIEDSRGLIAERRGFLKPAIAHFRAAHELALRVGDRESAGSYLMNVGRACASAHLHRDAIDAYVLAQQLFANLHDARSPQCLAALGQLWPQIPGGYRYAAQALAESAARFVDCDDGESSVRALIQLTALAVEHQQFADASAAAEAANRRLEVAKLGGELVATVRCLPGLVWERQGKFRRDRKEWELAAQCHQQAMGLLSAVNDKTGVARNLRGYIVAMSEFGDSATAAATFEAIVDQLAEDVDPEEYARNLDFYALVLMRLGREDDARAAWEQARARFHDLGMTAAADNAAANARKQPAASPLRHRAVLDRPALSERVDQARALLADGDYVGALELAQGAFEAYCEAQSWDDAVRALVLVAYARRELAADHHALQRVLDELMPFYDESINGASKARLDCVVGTVLYELRRPEAEHYLKRAVMGADAVPMPEQAATARHELGLFYKSIGRVSEAVEHQERVVEYRRSQTAQPAQLADALLDLAAYLQTCGSAERAIVVIDEADDLLTRHGSDVARATSVYIRGVTYATVGDIAEGEALLARAARMFDAAGQPERGRSVRTDLGGRMVSRGDRAGLALLESFVGIHTGTSEASRRSTATGYFNLGIGYAAFGEDEQASQSFLLARAEYLSLGDPRAVAGCDHNLAALAFRSGRHDDARAVYQRLVDESRTPPVDGDRLASALAALGKVCRDQRDFEPALAAYREARSLYFAGGRLADTADCDIQLAAINGSLGASHLEVAADMLPAAVFIDARRHQFPDAQQRGAWSRLAVNSEWAFGRMLESAHRSGDARLVAELIEFLINSGVHSADGVSDAPSDTGVWPHDEPVSDVVDEPESSEGALRLIVGARLPMTPAPRLAWHTGELVLSPYVEESAVRYAPVLRPPTVTLDLPSSL